VSPGRCLEGKFGGDDGGDKSIDFRLMLWVLQKNREGNYLVCLWKWFWIKSESFKTLSILLA